MEKINETEKADENDNSNIEFDTSVLQQKNEIYSSLTDTYGIDLFTDQYEANIQNVHLKEANAYQKIEDRLFEMDFESKKDEYEKIQDQLFLYTGSEIKKEEVKRTDNNIWSVTIAITGIMLMLFFLIYFLIFNKRNKRRDEDAVNNNTYE